MFSKVYDDAKTRYSKRYFKFYQTPDEPPQTATPNYDSSWDHEVISCKVIDNWPEDASVSIRYNKDGMPDLPWFVGSGTFASQRFCNFARGIGEDQMQFLPVQIELDGLDKSQVHESYSVVNWLREVDCLHRELADFHPHPRHGFLRASHLVLDESLIPDDTVVFKPTHYMSVLIVREDFLETLASNGITGWHTMGIEVG